MALILVMAKEHWMDKLSKADREQYQMADSRFEDNYLGRFKQEDIVEVREDDAPFGRKECLPNFLVVKVPGTKKEHEDLMASVYEGEKLIERRTHKFEYKKKISATRLAEIEQAKEMLVDTFAKSDITMKKAQQNRTQDS